MHLAAASGDAAAVRSWLAAGGNVDLLHDESDTLEYPREKGITPLMLAAKNGRLDVVELLAKAGAKLYRESYIRKATTPTATRSTTPRRTTNARELAMFLIDNVASRQLATVIKVQDGIPQF